MTDENRDKVLDVRFDATGVAFSISKGLPDIFKRLMPAKYQRRRAVEDAITSRLLDKIVSNEAFDEAEVAFAEHVLPDHVQKYIRLKGIEERGYSLFEQGQRLLLEAGTAPAASESTAEASAKTSDDFVNKFREDASLVDDQLVSEIYARVLAEEAQRPTAFSLGTLRVLRYLDRRIADAFGLIQKVLIDGSMVPQQSPEEGHILSAVGLDHSTMLMLDDAGLVSSTASVSTYQGDLVLLRCSGHGRLLLVRRANKEPVTFHLNVHLLTTAGRELSGIAQCEPDEAAFEKLTDWLLPQLGGADLFAATLPSRDWSGQLNELKWLGIKPDEPQTASAAGSES